MNTTQNMVLAFQTYSDAVEGYVTREVRVERHFDILRGRMSCDLCLPGTGVVVATISPKGTIQRAGSRTLASARHGCVWEVAS